jgi:hypothetical protein
MNALELSLIAFGCIFGGVLVGLSLRKVLPVDHLSSESKEIVKIGTGFIATLTALVMGLLISSAKNNFDVVNSGLVQNGTKILMLDRTLAQYGPDAKVVRDSIRSAVISAVCRFWPEKKERFPDAPATPQSFPIEVIQEHIQHLTARDDGQRRLQSQALQLCSDLMQIRWQLVEQTTVSLMPPFLVVLFFWLTILFTSFGLIAPRNATVIAILFVCAASAAGAIFLMQELSDPMEGLMKVSPAPLLQAIQLLGK